MLVSDKQWLSRVRGLLQRHCSHFIKGRIELINAKVAIVEFGIKIYRTRKIQMLIENCSLQRCHQCIEIHVV